MVSLPTSKPYKSYQSPLRKLVGFFERSRDQWKAKCRAAKKRLKRLKNRVRFLEQSRDRWKERAKELEAELVRLKSKQASLEKEIAGLNQNRTEAALGSSGLDPFRVVPAHHTYSVGHSALFVELVLTAAISLRAAGRVFELVVTTLGLPLSSPSWSAGRLWLLRLGYYKLTRSKEPAEDWVWIVDHSLQLGSEKCLVILGVRLSTLPAPARCLGHGDVEPLALFVVKQSNGSLVYQQLEETMAQTGRPRAIVADKGTDLHAGIQQFCQAHPETDYIYDIKHKTAAVLRQELADEPGWLEFSRRAAQTKRQVQQTALAALAPPQQKSKARYMNVDTLIDWGQKMLRFLDQAPAQRAGQFDPAQVEAKLGWLTDFRPKLAEWHQLLADLTTIESFVRKEGLYSGTSHDLNQHLPSLQVETERTRKARQQLLDFVTTQAAKAQANERLLGSSEVIESVFGKLKRVEQDQARSGFTGLLLSVAALVSHTTTEVVQKALETVPTKTVLTWCQEKLGPSVQAQRREALTAQDKPEQKWDQLPVPI